VYRFPVKVEPRGEGYVATVPGLPGCVAGGRTSEEALRQVREVLQAILMQAGPSFTQLAGPRSAPFDVGDGEHVEVAGPPREPC
jgi:hypothetical protein